MKRILRWIGLGFASVATLVVCVTFGAFAASEAMIRWPQQKAKVELVAARDPGAVMRGKRLATIYGCHDCHGAAFEGKLVHDEPAIVRASGPTLSHLAPHQSDADLARAIRAGIAADGRALWIMPSDAFAHLSDGETADLITYVRSFPAKGEPKTVLQVGPVGRIGVLLGKFRSAPANLKQEHGLTSVDLGPQYAEGRSLARACMECHGRDLKGSAAVGAPDLTIAGAYDEEDFERLMLTGVAAGDRKLGLMGAASRSRFSALSHEEIGALYGYLKARAEKAS